MHWVNAIGWMATAMSVVSYLFRDPATLRRFQALAALLWIVYGVMLVAPPMIVANVIVAGMAFGTTWFGRSKRSSPSASDPPSSMPSWNSRRGRTPAIRACCASGAPRAQAAPGRELQNQQQS